MRKRYFDLRVGESVTFGASRVTADAKTGSRIRICVETPGDIAKGKGAGDSPLPRPQPAAPVTPFLPRPKKPGY